MTASEVRTSTDVDRLWIAFMDARGAGDRELTALIRRRIGELTASPTTSDAADGPGPTGQGSED